MTVKELIEKLKDGSQDATVRVANVDGYWPRITGAYRDDATDDVLLIID